MKELCLAKEKNNIRVYTLKIPNAEFKFFNSALCLIAQKHANKVWCGLNKKMTQLCSEQAYRPTPTPKVTPICRLFGRHKKLTAEKGEVTKILPLKNTFDNKSKFIKKGEVKKTIPR